MISLVVVGAAGRMGRAIEEAAATLDDVRVRVRIDRTGTVAVSAAKSVGAGGARAGYASSGIDGTVEDLGRVLEAGDVVVDFSGPEGACRAAEACAARGVPLVTGTTGLGVRENEVLAAAARRVAVLRAANFSLGVLALRKILGTALAWIPKQWDIEIVERHHRHKADSPSGTALLLAREALQRRGGSDSDLCFGRNGHVGERPSGEIGVHAVRGGSWVGDHTMLFAGAGEWIELRHVAQDRGAFARGAIEAARFVLSAAPGLYTLDDLQVPSS